MKPAANSAPATPSTDTWCRVLDSAADRMSGMYFTDRGIEELAGRRGEEQVSLEWLADRLQTFVDLNPEFEVAVDRFATWLARADDEDE